MNGLTIGTGTVLLNLDNTQQQFQKTVTQLSSGLRINSAADDPSGNAIATNLQSRTLGIQQAAQNVQNANNALNVAMGALNSVQTILERINTLIVESNSDINSTQDLEDIQTEINSLMSEINTIGEKTTFNGLNLLDGAFDTSEGSAPTTYEVNSPFGGSTDAVNYNGAPGSLNPGQSGPLFIPQATPPLGFPFVPGLAVITVTGYSSNALDPDSASYVGPAVYLQFDGYTSDVSATGAPLTVDVSAWNVGQGQAVIPFSTANDSEPFIEGTLANLTANDVGESIAFYTTAGTAAAGGQQLTVNDGGGEGTIVGISLPTVNTNALGLNSVSVLAPDTEGVVPGSFNEPENLGTNSSNQISASYSEILVGNALTQITTAQAQIGAQVVSLNIDDTNDNTAANALTQSASNIADLNIGQATTQFTQEQILVSVGTSVLAQMNTDSTQNTALLIQALVA